MVLREKLGKGKFVFTSEIGVHKGSDLRETVEEAKRLSEFCDAVNVPDNPRAVGKISPGGVCHFLESKGIETIMHLTCRDRNSLALQSELLSAHALGVRNVLALTGDKVKEGDSPFSREVFELDSLKLVELIAGLNSGKDFNGNGLEGNTEFFIGSGMNAVAAAKDIHSAVKKIVSGADFFQTQIFYGAEEFFALTGEFKPFNAKILAGIMPLKSAKMARFLNEKVPGVNVPEEIIKRMGSSANPEKEGIEIAGELIEEIKKNCAGIHLMPLGNSEAAKELVF